ncbi:MAG: hypothetical protein ABIK68_13790 [bacterium]
MSIFDRFTKGKKAESAYFEQKKGSPNDSGGSREESLPGHLPRSGKKLDKALISGLLRTLKSHDLKASIGVFSNTTDSFKKETGLMINKGIVSKKIIAYLQEMRMSNIEAALSHVRSTEPDVEGFYTIDDRLAGKLNLPADVVIFPVFSSTNADLGLILVARKGIPDKAKLAGKIRKAIK